MKDNNELALLIEGFKKCRLAVKLAESDRKPPKTMENELDKLISGGIPSIIEGKRIEEKTLYRYCDGFRLCYRFAKLDDAVLCVGPYLSSPVSDEFVLEISAQFGISPKEQKYLSEFYGGIPVLDDGSALFMLLDAFLERSWKTSSFSIVDCDGGGILQPNFNDLLHNDDSRDVLVNMRAMEQRYQYENELCKAVTLGQVHKEGQLFASLSATVFEKRTSDTVRNAKNYCIIINTLLRKAAERGGVHPVYLDRVSTDFAIKIEKITNLSETTDLMLEMFRSYCRLVRKHSVNKYSPTVQKTILIIDSDLARDLSLSVLAEAVGVSAGYLSAIFKRETGQTLSYHVAEKRMKYAAHLLSTTNIQIQTVALHCGILDVQYFSKKFKKHIGKTPGEYRADTKKQK